VTEERPAAEAGRAGPLVVVAALAERGLPEGDRAVFLARRAPSERHGGLWELPGGKVEPGETPEEALLRELGEELGLAARILGAPQRYEAAVEGRSILFLVYPVDLGGEPAFLAAHDTWVYAPPDRLADFRLAPLDGPALAAWAAGVETR